MNRDNSVESSEPSAPLITVAICTFNRHDFLAKTIDGVLGQTLPHDRFKVLIVDNSADRKAAQAFYDKAEFGPRVCVVWSTPPGLSRARNHAIEICTTPYIAFLDDDAVPEPGWLFAIVEGFRQDDRTAAVGGPIQPIWAKERPGWLPETYLGLLTIHEPADEDCDLGAGM